MADYTASAPAFNPLSGGASGASSSSSGEAESGSMVGGLPPAVENTSSRDFVVGGGLLLVLMVAFLFAKNAYANSLVSKRVPPRSANAAGWWLFIFLSLLALGAVVAGINRSALSSVFVAAPLCVGAAVALILMLLAGRR